MNKVEDRPQEQRDPKSETQAKWQSLGDAARRVVEQYKARANEG